MYNDFILGKWLDSLSMHLMVGGCGKLQSLVLITRAFDENAAKGLGFQALSIDIKVL